LKPYVAQVVVALRAIMLGAALQLVQPYLVKVAVDRHIATGRTAGLELLAATLLAVRRAAQLSVSAAFPFHQMSAPIAVTAVERTPRTWMFAFGPPGPGCPSVALCLRISKTFLRKRGEGGP
jgi:hypothetical protein